MATRGSSCGCGDDVTAVGAAFDGTSSHNWLTNSSGCVLTSDRAGTTDGNWPPCLTIVLFLAADQWALPLQNKQLNQNDAKKTKKTTSAVITDLDLEVEAIITLFRAIAIIYSSRCSRRELAIGVSAQAQTHAAVC